MDIFIYFYEPQVYLSDMESLDNRIFAGALA